MLGFVLDGLRAFALGRGGQSVSPGVRVGITPSSASELRDCDDMGDHFVPLGVIVTQRT